MNLKEATKNIEYYFSLFTLEEKENLKYHLKNNTGILCGLDAYMYTKEDKG